MNKIFLFFILISLTYSSIMAYGYNNPYLPIISPVTTSTTTIYSNLSWNESYANGLFWNVTGNQTGLSGTKNGTYYLTTTGILNASSVYANEVIGETSVYAINFIGNQIYNGSNDYVSNNLVIDLGTLELYDSKTGFPRASIDWYERQLHDTLTDVSLDWENKRLYNNWNVTKNLTIEGGYLMMPLGYGIISDSGLNIYPDVDTTKGFSFSNVGSNQRIFTTSNLTLWSFGGNIDFIAERINTTGNITASYYIGNGSQLTDVCLLNGSNCPTNLGNLSWNESYASSMYVKNNSGTIGRIPLWEKYGASINDSIMTQTGASFIGVNTTTARRQLDVLDASNPQLRITQTDNSKYVDFQATASGNLAVTASGTIVSFGDENVLTTGYLTLGSALNPSTGGYMAAYSTTFPVGDFYRDTKTSVAGHTGVLKVERLMKGGIAVNNSGAGIYFKSPNDANQSTYAGFMSGGLAGVNDGNEIGEMVFSPAYNDDSSIYLRRHLVLKAKSQTESVMSLQGDLNQTTGNTTIQMVYGGIYNFTSSSFSFASEDVYYNFSNGYCGLLNGFSCTSSTGTLTAQIGGVYKVNYVATGIGDNNHLYNIAIAINDVIQNNTQSFALASSGDTITMTGIGHISLTAGQRVNLQIQDTSGTGTGTLYSWNMVLERIGN